MRFLLLLVMFMALLVAITASATAPASAPAGLPDLIIDQARVASSWQVVNSNFKSDSCAVVEGCVNGTGKRRLLRFDVATPNIGTADLVLGDPAGNPLFVFSSCHGHYHFSGYAEYNLLNSSGTATVLNGRKQAFCLRDSSQYLSGNFPSHGYNCSNQGLSVGWQDVYSRTLTCQWLDITGVPSGDYILEVIINPHGVRGEPNGLTESDYTNNTARVSVHIN